MCDAIDVDTVDVICVFLVAAAPCTRKYLVSGRTHHSILVYDVGKEFKSTSCL